MSAPPANPRRRHGQLAKLSPEKKQKRAEKRKRKKTWASRVWVKRHVKGDL